MKNMLVSPNFKDIFPPNLEIGSFPDGDIHVHIPRVNRFRKKKVLLFHRLYPDQNKALLELFFILNILKSVKAEVVLVSPYLPYARQDKVFLEGESLSAKMVCQMIRQAGCQKLVTFDCHFLKKEGNVVWGSLPIKNISLSKELIARARSMCPGKKCEVIGPDEGAAYLVKGQGGKSMRKERRAYKNGKIGYRHIENMEYDFDVKGKNVLILDDMISTGSTMMKAIEAMKKGGAKKVFCAATHGFFLRGSLEKLETLSDGVFVSNTIPSAVSKINIKEKLGLK